MKLAVRKEAGQVPGGGFHYMLFPKGMSGEAEAEIFAMMGHIIIEVPDEVGTRLIEHALSALNHQMEIATLTEKSEYYRRIREGNQHEPL